jgi:hypothetical protein
MRWRSIDINRIVAVLTCALVAFSGCNQQPTRPEVDVAWDAPQFAPKGGKGKPQEPQFDYHADVADNDGITPYWVASDGGGTYVRRVDCVGVGPVSHFSTVFHLRTVRNTEECHAIADWRFFELHVQGNAFDFDQDGVAEPVEQVPGRFILDDVFTDGATSVKAGLDVFTVDDDGTTSSAFAWHIRYANNADRVAVDDNTVDIILPPARADVASLCEYVQNSGRGKKPSTCENRDPTGLKLPFEIRVIRFPLQ